MEQIYSVLVTCGFISTINVVRDGTMGCNVEKGNRFNLINNLCSRWPHGQVSSLVFGVSDSLSIVSARPLLTVWSALCSFLCQCKGLIIRTLRGYVMHSVMCLCMSRFWSDFCFNKEWMSPLGAGGTCERSQRAADYVLAHQGVSVTVRENIQPLKIH